MVKGMRRSEKDFRMKSFPKRLMLCLVVSGWKFNRCFVRLCPLLCLPKSEVKGQRVSECGGLLCTFTFLLVLLIRDLIPISSNYFGPPEWLGTRIPSPNFVSLCYDGVRERRGRKFRNSFIPNRIRIPGFIPFCFDLFQCKAWTGLGTWARFLREPSSQAFDGTRRCQFCCRPW